MTSTGVSDGRQVVLPESTVQGSIVRNQPTPSSVLSDFLLSVVSGFVCVRVLCVVVHGDECGVTVACSDVCGNEFGCYDGTVDISCLDRDYGTVWWIREESQWVFWTECSFALEFPQTGLLLARQSLHRRSLHHITFSFVSCLHTTFSFVPVLTTDFIQALGWTLISYHLAHNSVIPSPACTIQGILINTGDLSSAIWSFVIAVHTFLVLTGGKDWGEWAARKSLQGKARWIICAGLWFAVVFLGVIGIVAIERINTPDDGPFCMAPVVCGLGEGLMGGS